ncbi:hypothetical protein ACFVZW_30715 [Streptomyces sp. NPDC059567]|uniref:hypothetical protein n=1 Tax=Streptomyces sp. NPDC059567 TaxID=3346867 RepID=UPI00367A90D5
MPPAVRLGSTPSDSTPSSIPSPGGTPSAPPSDAVVPGPSATGDDTASAAMSSRPRTGIR